MLLTALIGQTVKLRWKLSLQVARDGPARLVATDYFAPVREGEPARMRAFASFDADRLESAAPGFAQVGQGYFAILIDQGRGTTPYQGITPITGDSLASCAREHISRSPSNCRRASHCPLAAPPCRTAVEGWRAGGVMLQHMPKGSPSAEGGGTGEGGLLSRDDMLSGDDEENWTRANVLLDTVDDLELVGPAIQPTDLLVRLFHEGRPTRLRPADCGIRLHLLGRQGAPVAVDLFRGAGHRAHETTEKDGKVHGDCQFCGAHYGVRSRDAGVRGK